MAGDIAPEAGLMALEAGIMTPVWMAPIYHQPGDSIMAPEVGIRDFGV